MTTIFDGPPMSPAELVNDLRRSLRYRLEDARHLRIVVREVDEVAAMKMTAGSINLEAAIRSFYAAYERLLEVTK